MRDAFIVLLIASSATASSSVVKAQMALAADYHRPVLVVWAGGQDGEQPRPGEWKAEAVIDARAERYERACTELVVQVKQQERMISASQTQTELFFPEEPRNPYKGLHAFTTEDARDFFGREALVDELMKTDNSSEVQKPVPGTLRVIEMVIPGVRMIRTYQRCWLRADLVATVLASVAAGSR